MTKQDDTPVAWALRYTDGRLLPIAYTVEEYAIGEATLHNATIVPLSFKSERDRLAVVVEAARAYMQAEGMWQSAIDSRSPLDADIASDFLEERRQDLLNAVRAFHEGIA